MDYGVGQTTGAFVGQGPNPACEKSHEHDRQAHERRMQSAFQALQMASEIRANAILMADLRRWLNEQRQKIDATIKAAGI